MELGLIRSCLFLEEFLIRTFWRKNNKMSILKPNAML